MTILTVFAGSAMASNYVLQPSLPEIAEVLRAGDRIGLVAGAMPFGYMVGLLCLLPLGDRIAIPSLIRLQSILLITALLLAAIAPTLWLLVFWCFWVGMMATATAHAMTLAARTWPTQRGRVVGAVATGVSLGILIGRLGGGVIAHYWSWRLALVGNALALAGAGSLFHATFTRFPDFMVSARATTPSADCVSVLSPQLWRRMILGACWFASFCGFWACLSLHLADAPFGYGADLAGAFAILGLAGAVIAQLAGRMTDYLGARIVIASGLAQILSGFAVLWVWPHSLTAMIVGTLLIDIGCFAAQAANQASVLALGASRQSRIFSFYMVAYYGAGAVGAAGGPAIFQNFGWASLCLAGVVLAILAMAVLWKPMDA